MRILDTVAAVSTPYGKGGVALIRISGVDAISIADRVFKAASGRRLADTEHAKIVYGEIFMPDEKNTMERKSIDDVMAVAFRAPHSFTGENTVEISCHGGILVTQKVLSAVLLAGARAAEAGEFTRRAYISGKLKLTEAEALGDLLDARSESQLVLARSGMKGRLSKRMSELYESLLKVLSGIYAVIDFPDEDLADMSRDEMQAELDSVLSGINRLLGTYGTGRAISEGIPTVICGRTNAGKSSVYNRLLGYDAAIVTDIEGTTRDVLRETAILGRSTLLLCDTAGLRDTNDKVESIGIERSLREIESAELVLAVFDGSREPTDEDRALADRIIGSGRASVALINKSDMGCAYMDAFADLCDGFDRVLSVSAENGEGFDRLCESVEELFMDGSIDIESDAVVTGARQFASIRSSAELLERAIADMRAGMSLDACCVGVECAMAALGEVDGREIGEEIVLDIFSRFCVGK
ncbi:MAG: tRNA uridine-5-carboxymethylaminomethyl(34) synthesis GTPase MnmE [Clostridia bacterium]|nr:tRNA uridine-5-carboxymethylaminomethyl(34) synthesis GTPase MnmE [Clostridia bacterium]